METQIHNYIVRVYQGPVLTGIGYVKADTPSQGKKIFLQDQSNRIQSHEIVMISPYFNQQQAKTLT